MARDATPTGIGTDPMRHPESAPLPLRSKRAAFLLLLTVFVPGGAQVVAGNRALGRRALAVTIGCWAVLLAVLAVALVNRGILIEVLARPSVQLVLAVVLAVLAVGWVLLFLNTLAIIRPRLLAPGMRAIVAAATVVLMVATGGLLGYGAHILNMGRGTISDVFASGPPIEPVDGRYNILVMGGDAGENRIGLRPDSINLFSIDADSGQTAVISVPRNFQNAPFPEDSPLHGVYPEGFSCGDECIINALYPTVEAEHADLYPEGSNAGAEATMDAMEGITGLKVQGYVLVDMGGFEEFIDAMGGVSIVSEGWVPYRGAPREDTTVRTRWFAPGEHTFNGEQALWFARSRYFTTDYHRIRRQQCLQQAMMSQFNPKTVLTRFSGIMEAGEELVETNLPQSQLGGFLNLADKATDQPFERLTLGAPDFGTSADRFSTFPDFEEIRARLDTLLAQASDEGSQAAGAGPAGAPAAADAPAAAGSSAAGPALVRTASTESASGEEIEPGLGGSAVPTTQRDGSPITEEYLIELEMVGDTERLELIASNNSGCAPA